MFMYILNACLTLFQGLMEAFSFGVIFSKLALSSDCAVCQNKHFPIKPFDVLFHMMVVS